MLGIWVIVNFSLIRFCIFQFLNKKINIEKNSLKKIKRGKWDLLIQCKATSDTVTRFQEEHPNVTCHSSFSEDLSDNKQREGLQTTC